jgi:hypothetical protein
MVFVSPAKRGAGKENSANPVYFRKIHEFSVLAVVIFRKSDYNRE